MRSTPRWIAVVLALLVLPLSAAERPDRIEALVELWGQGHYLAPDVACAPDQWDETFADGIVAVLRGSLSADEFEAHLERASGGAYFRPSPQRAFDVARMPDPSVNEFDEKGSPAVVRLRGDIRPQDRERWKSLRGASALVLDLRSRDGEGVRDLARRSALLESPDALEVLGVDLGRLPAIQTIEYRGFPSETGFSSGYFRSELKSSVTAQETSIGDAGKMAAGRAPLLIIIGNRNTMLPRVALAARMQGRAVFLSTDGPFQFGGLPSTAAAPDLEARVLRLGRFENQDLASVLRPDGMLTERCAADDACVRRLQHAGRAPAKARAQTCRALPADDPTFAGKPAANARAYSIAKAYFVLSTFHPRRESLRTALRGRLASALDAAIAASSDAEFASAVGRFIAGNHDPHLQLAGRSFFEALGLGAPPLSARFERGKLAVACTGGLADLAPGDEITRIDGAPALTRLRAVADLVAQGADDQALQSAARHVLRGAVGSQAHLALLGRDGRSREIAVERGPLNRMCSPAPAPPAEPFSWVGTGIAYLDLSRLGALQVDALAPEIATAGWLIVDLRRYPQGGAWALAAHLTAAERFPVATFLTPVVASDDADPSQFRSLGAVLSRQQWSTGNKSPLSRAKVLILVGGDTLSQGEHSVLLLKAATDAKTVGARTGGASGDLTGITLPVGLAITFTGQEVKPLDGSELLGRGFAPDIEVRQLGDDAKVRDPVLQAARDFAQKDME